MLKTLVTIALLGAVASEPIIRALPELQVVSGGFHEIGSDSPDIDSTASALFLASLYGQSTQINADDAVQYVASLRSASDSGYGASIGMPSTLEATRLALECYLHLGREIPDAEQTGEYIRSLFNVNNGLFASQAGGDGDLKATAIAVEALDILGELQKPVVQEMLKRTKDLLRERVVESEGAARFVLDPESTTPVVDNYYGIYLAVQSGFDFGDKAAWAKYLQSMQDLEELSVSRGGFFNDEARNTVSTEATALAARSLFLLEGELDATALLQFVQSRKYSIRETAQSHFALAHTTLFKSLFQIRVFYDPIDEGTGQFVQGMRVTPVVRVTVFDGSVIHGGFSIAASEPKGWVSALPYDLSLNIYVASSELDTADRLGDVAFSYTISSNVYPVGAIQFSHDDTKRIGYKVAVEDSATFGGRDLEEGESVLPGTDFQFGVTLATESNDDIESGDFEIVFSVKDASDVVQHSETIDGSSNSKAIAFSYSLTGADFPSGAVQFVFEVRNADGVHTSRTLVRSFEQQMVASQVSVSENYQLGSTLSVTMQPGSLKDLHTVAPFSKTNAAKRSFVMDVSSAQGTTILSVPGVVVDGASASYKFETVLPTTLDVIGENTVSFRFVPANPEFATRSVKLLPFDTASNELFEDVNVHAFTVAAELHLFEVEAEPTAAEYTYGSSIPLKFQIQDSMSGNSLVAGSLSGVFVALKSRDQDFESSRVAAVPEGNVFDVAVEIDANALAGDASIVVSAITVDDVAVPILAKGSRSAAKYDVTIGGEIAVSSEPFTTKSLDASKTAFVINFGLTCADKPLSNARLFADVLALNGSDWSPISRDGSALTHLAVARDTTAGANSRYALSVTLPHDQAKTGAYKVVFRRGVDIEQGKAAPLFELDVAHKEVESGGFFLRMEFVTILILGTLFAGAYSHRVLFGHRKLA